MSATDKHSTQSAAANAVASSDMVWPEWTNQPPKAIGYYWWRHDPKCVPFIVEVRPFRDGEREAVFPWGRTIIFEYPGKCDAQWAGPIPLPYCHTNQTEATA